MLDLIPSVLQISEQIGACLMCTQAGKQLGEKLGDGIKCSSDRELTEMIVETQGGDVRIN
jgi:hypothetical protein